NPLVVGPARLASRVRDILRDQTAVGAQGEVPIHVSIGFSIVEPRGQSEGEGEVGTRFGAEYFSGVAEELFANALAALGEAQASGGNAVRGSQPVAWPALLQN